MNYSEIQDFVNSKISEDSLEQLKSKTSKDIFQNSEYVLPHSYYKSKKLSIYCCEDQDSLEAIVSGSLNSLPEDSLNNLRLPNSSQIEKCMNYNAFNSVNQDSLDAIKLNDLKDKSSNSFEVLSYNSRSSESHEESFPGSLENSFNYEVMKSKVDFFTEKDF